MAKLEARSRWRRAVLRLSRPQFFFFFFFFGPSSHLNSHPYCTRLVYNVFYHLLFSYSNSSVHVNYCSYTKRASHGEMAFLTSRSASKHDIFALGVDPTARDAGKGGGSDLVSQTTPFAVSWETSSQPSMFPRYTSLVSPSLARRQTNAVEFVSKVCFSLFDSSKVIARLTLRTKGKFCIVQRLRNLRLAPRTDNIYVDRS